MQIEQYTEEQNALLQKFKNGLSEIVSDYGNDHDLAVALRKIIEYLKDGEPQMAIFYSQDSNMPWNIISSISSTFGVSKW